MKMPKYILRVAGSEFAVPDSTGIATLIKMLEDAIPVHADLREKTIEVAYTDEGPEKHEIMVMYMREVRITKIPPGCRWKRKLPDGTTENVQPTPLADRKKPAPPKRPALRGREMLQLEFRT